MYFLVIVLVVQSRMYLFEIEFIVGGAKLVPVSIVCTICRLGGNDVLPRTGEGFGAEMTLASVSEMHLAS